MSAAGGATGRRGASVRLEGLWKAYADVVAVRDVTLSVAPGEFVTLLGPSGSGKTTTLMAIAGFVAPSRGEIYIDDRAVGSVPPQKRDLGVVFQNYALFPHMTVADNVAFPLQMRRLARQEVARRVALALETVRLPGYEARFPRQLSGGQQQRVALARAVVFEPRVLLMDEPLGALDRKLREQLQLEIKHIQRRLGITVLYVTHDQGEALTMSDRIAVMRDGRVVQFGTPDNLYEEPVDAFVADFVGESNFLRGVVVGAGGDGLVEVKAANGQGFRAVGRPAPAPGAPALASVRPERLALERGGPADQTLNRWRGRVEEIIYAGDATKYKIAVAETVLTAKTQNRGLDRAPRPGDLVDVVWDPRHTRLLSDAAAPTPAAPGAPDPVPATFGDR
jgi:spermidine/putrescine ABC transporter ATP-binding subunit